MILFRVSSNSIPESIESGMENCTANYILCLLLTGLLYEHVESTGSGAKLFF